jgi:hypothetical protein
MERSMRVPLLWDGDDPRRWRCVFDGLTDNVAGRGCFIVSRNSRLSFRKFQRQLSYANVIDENDWDGQ